jgi:hypothetical protein
MIPKRSFLSVFLRFNRRMFCTNLVSFRAPEHKLWEAAVQCVFMLSLLLLLYAFGGMSWPRLPFWPWVTMIAAEVTGLVLAWRDQKY